MGWFSIGKSGNLLGAQFNTSSVGKLAVSQVLILVHITGIMWGI